MKKLEKRGICPARAEPEVDVALLKASQVSHRDGSPETAPPFEITPGPRGAG